MKEIKVPELAESVTEGTIARWLVAEGDSVTEGQQIVELETDKVNLEITSEVTGTIKELLKQEGDNVAVGDVLATAAEDTEQNNSRETKEKKDRTMEQTNNYTNDDRHTEETAYKSENQTNDGETREKQERGQSFRPIASPAARKKARELGIDLTEVKTRDPLGRIRLHDIQESHLTQQQPQQTEKEKEATPELDNDRYEKIKMSRKRQTIAKRLLEAQHQAAMLTTFNEVDLSAIMAIRERKKQGFQEQHDVKLGFMSFFTKAVVSALKKYPYLNAEIQDEEIILKKFYDIGIAVSVDDGLVVPIVRDADKKSFAEIEKDIMSLAQKAKDKKLSLSDLQGGTFSITNGGVFGSLFSTPILNTPQVGILGMHTIQRRPVVVDDEDSIEVRPMMYIALSYDHRIIDGKDAVQFLTTIKSLLEDPEDLFLN
ncbi:2-oxoglutarate dehydrogenase complex dihydrolipoyllysine-residue succinyltransferase [Bacillus sp. HMF5848]|uniref:2-oxoglutarate dehydrogenase complex dihydrolipoyllysine-residue succinyltransferase n=1 Tax=Bacillus sp. HMF5848 TaxID=2495421 RepID=UPI000F7AC128|nr:2-oxoglutarate dehydrogenase complex dihydrolipoyllysine-residue succinyltransferase [Bacillus sp. HMF5848]RSK27194.1 2-oxoglutarate dehydrogenase complex dihydrolipoyllysine-residue succinyltransferase [Bacillus sp. HMF5848]